MHVFHKYKQLGARQFALEKVVRITPLAMENELASRIIAGIRKTPASIQLSIIAF